MRDSFAKLARGTLVYGLGGIASRAVGLLLLPVLTRYLTPADYGIAALLDLLVTSACAIFALGFGSSMTLSFFDRRDRDWQLANVGTALIVLLGSAALLFGAGTAFAGPLGQLVLGRTDRPHLLLLALALGSLTVLTVPLSLGLQLEERARRLVALNLFSTVATAGLSLLFVVPLGRGVAGLFEGRVVAQAITLAAFALQYPLAGLVKYDRRIARELLRLGLPMVPAFAATFVLLQGNRYVLSLFRDMDTVGIYSVGTSLGFAVGLAVSAFSTAWTPFFMSFSDRREEARELFARVTTYFALGFGVLLVIVFAAARPVVMVMTRPAFHGAYVVVGLAAAAQVFLGAFNLFLPQASFAREIPWTAAVQWVAALLSIGFNVLLIPRLGLFGAGIALALGPLLMVVLLHAWNRSRGVRYLDVPYEWGRVGGCVAVAALLALPYMWPRALPFAAELALGAAGALAALALAWWALGPSERRAVRGFLFRAAVGEVQGG